MPSSLTRLTILILEVPLHICWMEILLCMHGIVFSHAEKKLEPFLFCDCNEELKMGCSVKLILYNVFLRLLAFGTSLFHAISLFMPMLSLLSLFFYYFVIFYSNYSNVLMMGTAFIKQLNFGNMLLKLNLK